MNIGTLEIEMIANIARLQKDMEAAKGFVGDAMQNIEKMVGFATKALAVLGLAAGVDHFKGLVMGAINAQAELKQLSERTGATVESLSALKGIAKQSGTDMEVIAGGLQKLSANMIAAQDPSSKQAAAFKALGITSRDITANLNDTGKMSLLVAQRLDRFGEGAAKINLVREIMGKAGANALPFMKDLAEKGELNAKVTAKQAEEADRFQKIMVQWDARWKGLYSTIATEILPVLNDFFGKLVSGGGVAKKFTDYVKELAASGQLRAWAQGIASAVTAFTEAAVPAMKVAAAYFAIFVAAPALLTAVSTGFVAAYGAVGTLTVNMLTGNITAAAFNKTLWGTSISAEMAAGSLTKMKLAGSVLFAAFAGWEIGSYLSKNFTEARVAGLAFVGAILTGWEYVKYGAEMAWEGVKFAFQSVIKGLKSEWADYLTSVANGLSTIGASETAKQVRTYAESLRTAGGAQKTFAEQTAGITAAHKKALAEIDDNVVALIAFEFANEKAAKAVKKLGDATGDAKDELKFDPEAAAKAAAVAKAMLAAQLEAIKQAQQIETAKRADGLAMATELNRQGLVSDYELYQKRRKTIIDNAETEVTQKEMAMAAIKNMRAKDAAEQIKFNSDIATLDSARIEARRKADEEVARLDKAYEFDAAKGVRDAKAASDAEIMAINAETIALQTKIATYGMSTEAANEYILTKMRERGEAAAKFDKDGGEVEQIRQAIVAKRELFAAQKAYNELDKGSDLARATKMLAVMSALDDAAKDAAAGMADSFGHVGKAIGSLTTALTGYQKTQAAIAAELASVMKDPKADEQKRMEAQANAAEASARAQVKQYGDMASAAKGFFKENSAGYKAMQATEKAFRAFEMAMTIESMIRKLAATSTITTAVVAGKGMEAGATVAATTVDTASTTVSIANSIKRTAASTAAGVAKAFEQLGVWGFAGAAAIIAFVASMNSSGMSGGGGPAATTFEDRQKTQGTGTILGDGSAKSESMAKSLEIIKNNSSLELGFQNSMLAALRNIESALGGAAKGVFQTAGLTGGSAFGTKNESTKSFFGADKSTTITDSGIKFAGTLAELRRGAGTALQYEDVTRTTDGGWFHGNKSTSTTNTKALSEEALRPFTLIFDSMGSLLVGAGVKLGQDAQGITDALNQISVDFSVSTRDLKGQDLVDALQAGVSVAFDKVATATFPQIAQFQKVGEGMGETLVRVAANYSALDAALAKTGDTFGATGLASLEARERLIDLMGGIDELASKADSFAENYLTEAERLAPVAKQVDEALAALGYTGITTRDQFKAAVLQLDLTDAAQAKTYAGLMNVAEAFAKVHAAAEDFTKSAEDIASERRGLLNDLGQLTKSNTQLLKEQSDALDPSNRAIFDQIQAVKQAREAAEAYDAQQQKRGNMEIQLMEAGGDAAGALAARRQMELAGMDASLRPLQLRIYALQDEKTALAAAMTAAENAMSGLSRSVSAEKAAMQKTYDKAVEAVQKRQEIERQAAQDSVDAATESANAIKGVYDRLKSAAESAQSMTRIQAQSVLSSALAFAQKGGSLTKVADLDRALQTVAEPSEDLFASFVDYQRDQAATANTINALAATAGDQKSVAELTLAALKANAAAVDENARRELAVMASNHADDLQRLDDLVTNSQRQIDALKGVDTSVYSVGQAIEKLSTAIGNIRVSQPSSSSPSSSVSVPSVPAVTAVTPAVPSTPVPAVVDPATAALENLYMTVLGRQADAGGMAYWRAALLQGASLSSITEAFIRSDEYQNRLKGIPGYASGGDHAGGWRIVGENGPELEATGPSRIFTAQQTRAMLQGGGSNELVAEVRRLNATVEKLQASSKNIEGSTGRTAELIDNISGGGGPLLVEATT